MRLLTIWWNVQGTFFLPAFWIASSFLLPFSSWWIFLSPLPFPSLPDCMTGQHHLFLHPQTPLFFSSFSTGKRKQTRESFVLLGHQESLKSLLIEMIRKTAKKNCISVDTWRSAFTYLWLQILHHCLQYRNSKKIKTDLDASDIDLKWRTILGMWGLIRSCYFLGLSYTMVAKLESSVFTATQWNNGKWLLKDLGHPWRLS